MSSNATNRLMKYILSKVEDVVIATTLTKEYVEGYKTMLDGKIKTPVQNGYQDIEVKWLGIPYNDTDAIYAFVIDSTNNIWSVEQENTHNGIQLNKPFTIINTLILSEIA